MIDNFSWFCINLATLNKYINIYVTTLHSSGRQSVHLSVRPSFCNISCPLCNSRTHRLPSNLVTCCPHWDDVQWPWPVSIPQRLRSHKTFKGQSTHACFRAITYVCIEGLPSNLVQLLSSLRQCAFIQEYLGYRSNILYFLFSHSWPVVVYTFGQVKRTSQV